MAAFAQQRQAGFHGSFRVVFSRLVGTEHRQQVVPGVLQHLALVRFDDPGACRKGTIEHDVHVFRVELLGECRGANEIEEQHRDLPAHLTGHGPFGQRREADAQRAQCRIDGRVAQQRTLAFEAGHRGLQMVLFLRAHGRHSRR
jgi:hypothetical protein